VGPRHCPTAQGTCDRPAISPPHYDERAQTWTNTTWLGVRVEKCPLDLWIYQELLAELQPKLVIETGTCAGGSALFLACCMDLIGEGRVMTIDIDDRPELKRPVHPRIEYVSGSSTDPAIISRAQAAADRRSPVLVILDSDHSRDHVLAELHAYAPLVTDRSYLIVEDTNINGHPVFPTFGPGPHEATELFLAEHPEFTRDRACEKFFLTFNPGGFLQRTSYLRPKS
jgi:cephalosporin hydroxylase